MKKNSALLGFTLIELVVSIGILAIFSTFLVAVLNPFEQFKKAADTQRKSDLAQIQRGLEAYYQDYGRYPTASANKIVYNAAALNWGSSWAPYMDVLPKDDASGKNYVYVVSGDGQSYWLYTSLDRGAHDPQACNSGAACDGLALNGIAANACGGTCNYGVSSPNVSP
ncbi:MAG TPA: type II secretion system protein GspG [Patescibacteria group bacterium]|nr:type II secretion system protein GspG [Patescibacteria group bacterium]